MASSSLTRQSVLPAAHSCSVISQGLEERKESGCNSASQPKEESTGSATRASSGHDEADRASGSVLSQLLIVMRNQLMAFGLVWAMALQLIQTTGEIIASHLAASKAHWPRGSKITSIWSRMAASAQQAACKLKTCGNSLAKAVLASSKRVSELVKNGFKEASDSHALLSGNGRRQCEFS